MYYLPLMLPAKPLYVLLAGKDLYAAAPIAYNLSACSCLLAFMTKAWAAVH